MAIDGVQTCGLTCEESMKLLACYRSGISLFIEYDVADIGGKKRKKKRSEKNVSLVRFI